MLTSSATRFGLTLVCWIALFVALLVANWFIIKETANDQIGQLATGATVVLLTTFRYVLYPYCCQKEGKHISRKLREGQVEGCIDEEDEEEDANGNSSGVIEENKDLISIPDASSIPNSETMSNDAATIASSLSNQNTDSSPNLPDSGSNVQATPTAPTKPTSGGGRLVFLDHVKIFLTLNVVTFHVTCSFGGCGPGVWFLIVGNGTGTVFDVLNYSFAVLNQAYFMPLFFFISAYLVPPSYRKNNPTTFFAKKTSRLYVPALGTTLLVVPATFALSQYVRDKSMFYFPWPSHCWYLFWLLLLNWVYHSLCRACHGGDCDDTTIANESTAKAIVPFPKTWKRLVYGSFFCGALTLGMYVMASGAFSWALAPVSVGSIPCDIFMFTVGIYASNNGWLRKGPKNDKAVSKDDDDNTEAPKGVIIGSHDSRINPTQPRDLKSQMDISPVVQRCMVLVEIAAMIGLFNLDLESGPIWYPIIAFLMSGIYCVDMGLAVIQTFQQYSFLNREHKWTPYLSKAAYTVYLIHPLVVVAFTSLYIWGYNQVVGESSDDRIVFGPHDDEGKGGEQYFWVGWILVNAASHLVVWPLSWFLANLPVLRDIL